MGVCVYVPCGFVCGVGELLGWYGAEYTCAARGLFMLFMLFMQLARSTLDDP